MYQHILLPTDGSELSAAAIKSALQLAKLLGARVTGLCVVIEPLVAGGLGEVMIGHDHAVQAADSYLAALAGEARSQGVPHECFHVKGSSIAEEIVKAATTRGCDLICMASQGQHGLAGLLFGSSETVEVLNHCNIPVLVYR
jgi:nucleotide-binding universal stress UspA family protein